MTPSGTSRRVTQFAIRPTVRSPAKELGPRANRAIARILEATRSVFLTRGYGGTTIDEIARVADMSRASFYTYFPTKRDVLLTLGATSARDGDLHIERLRELPKPWSEADLLVWVDGYFEMLDKHGSFNFAWTQAAHEDDELRMAGMTRHVEMARVLGALVVADGDRAADEARGLTIMSMLERAWNFCQLYAGRIDPTPVKLEIACVIKGMADDRPAP
jgi:AcrR family transcriptional regulator